MQLKFLDLKLISLPQDVQLEDLQIAICAIECFLTTKVASIDPDFISQTDLVSQ